jgi:PKD repeat protein
MWEFGDGGISDNRNPMHVYQAAGTYAITLIAGNQYQCADTIGQTVDIFEQPVAGFVMPGTNFCEFELIPIVNTSQHNTSNCWFVNDTLVAMSSDLDLALSQAGLYDITLIAKYNDVCQDTVSIENAIAVFTTPSADFSYTADLNENIIGEVQFQNLSMLYDRVHWDFGDGNISNVIDPFHEYDINRSINVSLYAYNDNGGAITCVDSISKLIAPEWIVTFFAPNALSPDHGDSLIRVFKPVGTGLLEYDLSVFSPWGQRVWHTTALDETHPAESWNGRLDNTGDELPQGAFTWLAKVVFVNGESRLYKGSVTLLR